MLITRYRKPYHMTTTDRRRSVHDVNTVGSPANFAAFCREAAVRAEQGVIPTPRVQAFRSIIGFRVPRDGAWMHNGRFVEAGTELDVAVGDFMTYFRVRGQDGPMTRDAVLRAPQSTPDGSRLVDVMRFPLPARKPQA